MDGISKCKCARRERVVLIAPAGVYAADSVGGPIGNHQEAPQEPQRILDPVEFFDKTTGKVKVWYWRAESGYEFYDAPGFHCGFRELRFVRIDGVVRQGSAAQ